MAPNCRIGASVYLDVTNSQYTLTPADGILLKLAFSFRYSRNSVEICSTSGDNTQHGSEREIPSDVTADEATFH